MTLSTGASMGSFSFTDQAGKQYEFPGDFKDSKLAIFFLRHLGCPLCKEKIFELKAAAPRFEAKSVRLAAVVQSTPRRAADFSAKNGIGFILVPDREKILYQTFEVKKGGLREFTAPSAFKATIRATLKGHMHGRFEGDEFQVPAAFLLSPSGDILVAHYGRDISDFGDVDGMIEKA